MKEIAESLSLWDQYIALHLMYFPYQVQTKNLHNILCSIWPKLPITIFFCSNIFFAELFEKSSLKKNKWGNINSSFKITSDFPWCVMCKLRVWRVRTGLLDSGDQEVTLTLISCFVTLGHTKIMFPVTKTASLLVLSLLKCLNHSTLFSPSHSRLIQLLSYNCN